MQLSPVKQFILNNLSDHQKDIIRAAMNRFGISRQAILRHMHRLIQDGKIEVHGKTKDRYYKLKPIVEKTLSLDITSDLEEDKIGREHIFPHLVNFTPNVREICEYGFLEVMNNVISHSEGSECHINFWMTSQNILLRIRDNGMGIFQKIQNHFDFENQRNAILELVKGKMTTEPEYHPGDGLCITMKIFDTVYLSSGNWRLVHHVPRNRWSLKQWNRKDCTEVSMILSTSSDRAVQNVLTFCSAHGNNISFDRTVIPLILARYDGENLISRSQARRVLNRLDNFREVCFDFKQIEFLGEAFADEIFRIFQNDHKGIKLTWVNASENIESMINWILRNQRGNLRKI